MVLDFFKSKHEKLLSKPEPLFRVESADYPATEHDLNEMANIGWGLITIVVYHARYYHYFARIQ